MPEPFNPETGSGTWSVLLHDGLGYKKNEDLYPSGGDLIAQFGLRNNMPNAGQREYLPSEVIQESPLYQELGEQAG